jgi:hypothetical protein
MRGALLLVVALAYLVTCVLLIGPCCPSASAADAAACQIPTRYPPCGAVGLPALARPGEGKNQGAPSGRRLPPEGGLVWSLRSPPLHSSLLACGEPPGTRWARCQPRSPTRCCWPWMRLRPTPSCTGRAVANRSRWPSGLGTPGSRRPCLTTAQPSRPDPHRPPTGTAAEAGVYGCVAAWSMRSAWSVSSVARG